MASQYRLKRGPVVVLLLVLGVVGALLIARSSTRPRVDVYGPITVPAAYDGTTYALDGLLCVRAGSVGVRVGRVGDSAGARLGLRPAGLPPAVAFPAAADALVPLEGARVVAGDQLCTRLLVTPHGTGDQRPARVTVRLRYGPFGLLRSTTRVAPPVVLQVTGTGTDPRTSA